MKLISAPSIKNFASEFIVTLVILIGLGSTQQAPIYAQPMFGGDDIKCEVTAKLTGADLKAKSKCVLEIEAKMEPGWHIYGAADKVGEYAVPTRIEIKTPKGLKSAGKLAWPKAKLKKAEKPEDSYEYYSGKVQWTQEFEITEDASVAPEISLVFHYQACDDQMCEAPDLAELKVKWTQTNKPKENKNFKELRDQDDLWILNISTPKRSFAGEGFYVDFSFQIESGYYIYALDNPAEPQSATKIEFQQDDIGPIQPSQILGIEGPKPKPYKDKNNPKPMSIHESSVKFRVPLVVESNAAPGEYALKFSILAQICDSSGCIPIMEDISLPIRVADDSEKNSNGNQLVEDSNSSSNSQLPSESKKISKKSFDGFWAQVKTEKEVYAPGDVLTLKIDGEVDKTKRIPAFYDASTESARGGIWALILQCIAAALVALLTPCVYPMIPVTISMFTKKAHEQDSNTLLLATIFCLGIMGTFTLMGLTLSLTLGEGGASFMATNAYVNLFIGALFVYFAFSLFGYYDISLPSWVTRGAMQSSNSSSIPGLLLMGFVFSATIFTCVGPIIGLLLASASQGGQWHAMVGMLAFSATFSVPFFFLALFPKMASTLPKSGGWLGTVKVLLGFVELAAAWKFFSVVPGSIIDNGPNILFRELVLGIWGVTFLIAIAWTFGLFKFPHDGPRKAISLGSGVIVLILGVLTAFCFYGASGKLLDKDIEGQLTPSHPYFEELRAKAIGDLKRNIKHIDGSSEHDLFEELAKLDRTKPIFINFTGHV